MTDSALTVAAAVVELGVPLLLAVGWALVPRARLLAPVVLGATTPLLLAYCYVAFGYFVARDKLFLWAIGAMWGMSFYPFMACALVGLAISFIKRPMHPLARYLLGLAAPLPVGLLILAGV